MQHEGLGPEIGNCKSKGLVMVFARFAQVARIAGAGGADDSAGGAVHTAANAVDALPAFVLG